MEEIRYFVSNPSIHFERKSAQASGFDLYANLGTERVMSPGQRYVVGTGVYLAMPIGIEAQVRGRSGLTRDWGVTPFLGTIDADYRGEIGVTLFNHGEGPFKVTPGDRIAQLVFAPVIIPNGSAFGRMFDLIKVDTLEQLGETERGTSGYGSTGR